MFNTVVNKNPERPTAPGGSTNAVDAMGPLAQLFTEASTAECRAAAVDAFLATHSALPEGTLAELLGRAPVGEPLHALCCDLAMALGNAAVADPSVWHDLLRAAGEASSGMAPEQKLDTLGTCAREMGRSGVTAPVLWMDLLAAMSGVSEAPFALIPIAKAMSDAGVDQSAVWSALLGGLKMAGSDVAYGQVAHELARAGVTSAAAWAALLDSVRGDRQLDYNQMSVATEDVFRAVFSLATDTDTMVRLMHQVDTSIIASHAARIAPEDQRLWEALITSAVRGNGNMRALIAKLPPSPTMWRFLQHKLSEVVDPRQREEAQRAALKELTQILASGSAAPSAGSNGEPFVELFEEMRASVLAVSGANVLFELADQLATATDSGAKLRDRMLAVPLAARMDPSADKRWQEFFTSAMSQLSAGGDLKFACRLLAWMRETGLPASSPSWADAIELALSTAARGSTDTTDLSRLATAMKGVVPSGSPLWGRLLALDHLDPKVFVVTVPGLIREAAATDSLEQLTMLLHRTASSSLSREERLMILRDIRSCFEDFRDQPGKAIYGPRATAALHLVLDLALDTEQVTVHSSFRKLGVPLGYQLALNFDEFEDDEMRAGYLKLLDSAVRLGTLDLDNVEPIAAHRKLVQASAPSVHWDRAFHPAAHGAPSKRIYGGSPRLRRQVSIFVDRLKSLALAVGDYSNKLHKEGESGSSQARGDIQAWNDGLKALLDVVNPLRRKFVNQHVSDLWGKEGSGQLSVDQRLMDRLINLRATSPILNPRVKQAVNLVQTTLDTLTRSVDFGGEQRRLQDLIEALAQCTIQLEGVIASGTRLQSPAQQQPVAAFVKALSDLVFFVDRNIVEGAAAFAEPFAQSGAADALVSLIHTVTDSNQEDFSELVTSVWGPYRTNKLAIDARLLDHLILKQQATLDPSAGDAVQQLNSAANANLANALSGGGGSRELMGLRDLTSLTSMAWNALGSMIGKPDFMSEYNLCGDYTVALLQPDDVANLIVGHEVACCLSPGGLHRTQLLERLAGGWFVWSAKNARGETAAVAWAALNQNDELVIDFIDERVSCRVDPLGNDLVEALIAFAPDVADYAGVKGPVWLAPNGQGKLAEFDAFRRRPTEVCSFDLKTPALIDQGYSDSLRNGPRTYVRLR